MVWGYRWSPLIILCRLYDTLLGLLILVYLWLICLGVYLVSLGCGATCDLHFHFVIQVPVLTLSLLYVPTIIQTRLMFNNAFSRGVMINDLLRGSARTAVPVVSAPAVVSVSALPGVLESSSSNSVVSAAEIQRLLVEQQQIIARQREAIDRLLCSSGTVANVIGDNSGNGHSVSEASLNGSVPPSQNNTFRLSQRNAQELAVIPLNGGTLQSALKTSKPIGNSLNHRVHNMGGAELTGIHLWI